MRVRTTVRLTGNYGSNYESGSEFILGEKVLGENLSVADGDRYGLWTLDMAKCVIPYARPEWFEEIK